MRTLSQTPFSLISSESVENLLREYELPLQVPPCKFTSTKFLIGLLRIGITKKPDHTIIQIAKLALLMNSCKSGKLQFNATISNPKEGEIKGTQKKIEIENELFNLYFSSFLHSLISRLGGDLLENRKSWERKTDYNVSIDGIFEDWSEDELKAIIEQEESKASRYLNEYTLIGQRIKFLLTKLTDCDLFTDWTKTKIYSFLYDWGVLHGVFNDKGHGFSGEIGREKFTEINNRIKAYDKKAQELNWLT